jgi:hypothetical protein
MVKAKPRCNTHPDLYIPPNQMKSVDEIVKKKFAKHPRRGKEEFTA